jgi:hypothetical protein
MGLDNAIRLRDCYPEDIDFPWYVKPSFDGVGFVDVCYWRKCWGIRKEIFDICQASVNEYMTPISAEMIPSIMKCLEKFLKEDYWNENAESIWTYEQMFSEILQQIKNLCWLKEYLEQHPEAHCYFIDSY